MIVKTMEDVVGTKGRREAIAYRSPIDDEWSKLPRARQSP